MIRDSILKKQELLTETVDAYGETLTVSEISAEQRLNFALKVQALKGEGFAVDLAAMSLLVALTVFDEKGARVFKDSDAPELAKKHTEELRKVYDVAARLNGIGAEEDAAEKNSEPNSDDSSASD